MNVQPAQIASTGRNDPAAPPARLKWQPRHATLRVRLFVYSLLLDLVCLLTSFGIAPLLHGAAYSTSRLELVLGALIPAYVLTALNTGAYDARLINEPLRAAARGVRTLALAFAILLLAAFSLKASAGFSRLTLVIGSLLAMALLAVGRYVFARRAEQLIGGNPSSNVIICDDMTIAPPGNDSMLLLASAAGFDPESHDPGMYDRLAKALAGVDRVIVNCRPERRSAWAHLLKGANVQAEIIIPELNEYAPLGISSHDSATTLIVSTGPLALSDRLVKRAFDTVVAGLAIVFFSPILVTVAILIKLDSSGPIFFRQIRIGRGNEMFEMLKFRSMTVDQCDDNGHRSTSRDDDRITRVGRVIRMTSIDELPQLFNVLKGDMSIVGPRPHALGSRAADKLFWEIDSRYWHRHAAKPGLTGLAQIRGYRGATVHEHDLVNRLQADLEYLDGWSIWTDIIIILKTFRVLFHRNAY